MKQQDIVWVKLPFSNLEDSKIRPAVIVSNNEYNKNGQDVLVSAITSNLEERLYSILIDAKNLSQGKLPLKSRIRADKIIQVEKNLIINAFGKLDNKTFDLLIKEILKLLLLISIIYFLCTSFSISLTTKSNVLLSSFPNAFTIRFLST